MANLVEITPITREIRLDPSTGPHQARLLFSLTNLTDRTITLVLGLDGPETFDDAAIVIEGGGTPTLNGKSTMRIVLSVTPPPGLAAGTYRVRLLASGHPPEPGQPAPDSSAGVALHLAQPMPPAELVPPVLAPAQPKRLFNPWLWFGWITAPALNWFWGGKPPGARVLDAAILRRAVILLLILCGLSLVRGVTWSLGVDTQCQPHEGTTVPDTCLTEQWLYGLFIHNPVRDETEPKPVPPRSLAGVWPFLISWLTGNGR